MTATNVRPQRNPTPPQAQHLSDSDILEIVEPVYEWACWASDMGMVDFDTFAELSLVIRELRLRVVAAA